MLANLLLFTVALPLCAGSLAAVLARALGGKDIVTATLFALAGVASVWLIEGIPVVPPTSAKHKLLILAAVLVPLTAFGQTKLALPRARAAALLGFTLLALVWIGWSRLSDPVLLPRVLAVVLFLGLGAFALLRFDRGPNHGFAGGAALLATNVGLAMMALFSAHIGGAQLGGALAAVTGGALFVGYLTLLLGRKETAVLPNLALWSGFGLTSLVLIQSALFAPGVSLASVALLPLPLLLAAQFRPRLSTNQLAAPIMTGAAAILAASPAILAAAVGAP